MIDYNMNTLSILVDRVIQNIHAYKIIGRCFSIDSIVGEGK